MTELVAGLIDVFAAASLTGNPLAVVEGGDSLPIETLRRIAQEFNQAETTFILESGRADRKLRSFTASGVEVGGAGHNALGAWLWLGAHGDLGDLGTARTFQQEIGTDVLPITLERRDGLIHGRMKQTGLRLGQPVTDTSLLTQALGLGAGDVLSLPAPRTANTGVGHLMVRVRDAATVDRARPSAEQLLAVLKGAGAEGCYVYAFDGASTDRAYARFFNPTIGLWEDSATGTAAGPLCAYLGFECLLTGNTLLIEQGTRMGRQSFLHVRLSPAPELSGSGIVSLRGVLRF
jgi:PhzF family phenazine biosynthesis protein